MRPAWKELQCLQHQWRNGNRGNLKFATGSGNRKTILPLWLIIVLIGVIIYYVVIVINYRHQVGKLCNEMKGGKGIEELLNFKC